MFILNSDKDKCPLTDNDCTGNIGGWMCNDGNWVKCSTYIEFIKALNKEFKDAFKNNPK